MPQLRLLSISIILVFASLAQADYHYASHTGSNTYPYTAWETATDSVNAAVDAADPRDTVFIAAGEFEGLVVMYPADSLISIIGAGADSAHLITNQNHFLIYAGPKTYIEGLSFATVDPYDAIWAAASGRDVHVESCHFRGLGGAIFTSDSRLIVHNCIIENTHNFAIEEYSTNQYLEVSNCLFKNLSYQAVLAWSRGCSIHNNIILNRLIAETFNISDTSRGPLRIYNNLFSNAASAIIMPLSNPNSILENNSIDKAIFLDWSAITLGSDRNAIIENNSIGNSPAGIVFWGDSTLSVHYSNLWNIGQYLWTDRGHFDTTYGYIHRNPMFVNPDSGDLRLQAYSPLIDAGDPAILDYDGSRSDIGAFGGPDGYFYQYQDLPPTTPDSLRYSISGDSLIISWRQNTEADFWRYIVNRDTLPGFAPWAGNIIVEPETSLAIDLNWDRQHNYYYKIAAYDHQGNLSPYSTELEVRNVGIFGEPLNIPYSTYIQSNYPNPFNTQTTIVYYVADLGPIPAEIEIKIYDIQGRLIRALQNSREEVGEHKTIWDGRDDSNHELPSGVYFARMTQWGIDLINPPRKLVLLK